MREEKMQLTQVVAALHLAIYGPTTEMVQSQTALKALVWRQNKIIPPGCAESVAAMLQDTPGYDISVTYVGPDQDTKLPDDLLNSADIFAYPGGTDVDDAWPYLQPLAQSMRNFVSSGGRYIGVCLGAYLAGADIDDEPGKGFDLLPGHATTDSETDQDGAQVMDPDEDTVIRVDYTWGSGPKAGQTVKDRDMYFQDGAVIDLPDRSLAKILGRYSSNGDVAISVSPYGKGFVGVSGVHLEADESWCESAHILIHWSSASTHCDP